jgi:hypothetical protein
MEYQDWTPVTVRRRYTKKELVQSGRTTIQERDPAKNEKIRMAKLDTSDTPLPKKRVNSESLQSLIRKRIEMKLTQEKADNLCSFPRNTFKDIESNRSIPSEDQKRRIHLNFGIQLKIDTLA